MQVRGRSLELRLVGEIGGVDDQRVTFPMANGIAEPLANIRWRMRAVDADNANVVDHLNENQYVIRSLHDLIVVVVEHRKHRRSGRGAETDEAALGERPVLHAIKGKVT